MSKTSQEGAATTAAPYRLLAVDPGDTTGYVVFRLAKGGWKLEGWGQGHEAVKESQTKGLVHFSEGFQVVVVEAIPAGKGTPDQHAAHLNAVAISERDRAVLYEIQPSAWKPWAKARGIMKMARGDGLTGSFGHARDAYCMAKYALWNFLGDAK